eukprot:21426-Heterococcus_DN1.PRE.2
MDLQGYLYHYYCYYRLLLSFSHARSVSSLAPNDTISMNTAAAAAATACPTYYAALDTNTVTVNRLVTCQNYCSWLHPGVYNCARRVIAAAAAAAAARH